MSGEYPIRCRAQVAQSCFDGFTTRAQFGVDLGMSHDATFRDDDEGGTIVCDSCYMRLVALSAGTEMGELDDAIAAELARQQASVT